MAILVCKNCGQESFVQQRNLDAGRKYCSLKCKADASRKTPTEKKAMMACQECGQEFLVYKSWIRNGRRKYCSRKCAAKNYEKRTGEKSAKLGMRWTEEQRERASQRRAELGTVKRGPDHPQWKGGRLMNGGYVSVLIPQLEDAERAMACQMRPPLGYILEHRLVAAMALGRPLTTSELVHHLNGDKLDNRPENLTVRERGKHSQEHRQSYTKTLALEAENAELREEITRLRSLLVTCSPAGQTSLSPPEKT